MIMILKIVDIGYLELALSFLLMLIPIVLLQTYKINLTKATLISVVRMVVQLSLVAVYLELIFDLDNKYLNILWVVIMIYVSVATTTKRTGLKWKIFTIPLLLASLLTILIVDTFFLGLIIKLDNIFNARYFIPITGMILGNSLKHNIVGLKTYFKSLNEKADLYYFLLTNTSSQKLAIRPFIDEAIRQALNPLIASMAVIGLISLPGMMTGQILGGSSPIIAIKYQIIIMLAVFVGCTINLFLSILFSNRIVFDNLNNIKSDLTKRGE